MKLPRDISGRESAAAIGRLGYTVDHQTGSHVRLTTMSNREHHVAVPAHDPLKVGTLSNILRSVAEHHGMNRDQVLRELFGKEGLVGSGIMNKDITRVKQLGGCRLRLVFDDGKRREVDIAELVPFDGVFVPLNDPSFFRQLTVNPDVGTIVWPKVADLCPDVLYSSGLFAWDPLNAQA